MSDVASPPLSRRQLLALIGATAGGSAMYQAMTTLGDIAVGQSVNIEIDVLARYLQRMEAYRAKA